ncbi:LBF_2804 family protein [Photobacterium damselae]|uniref:LBF_2804 family protein n=1 Tax=Photobacterium damselae TaxID=38293 RepID=UPI004067DA56
MIEAKIESWGLKRVERYLPITQNLFQTINDKRLCQACVALSFFIGFITTFFIVAFEIYLELLGENWLALDNLIKLGLINLFFIGLELFLLFEVGFITTAILINRASAQYQFCDKMKASLVRAVMELSEPTDNIHGIKPYKQYSKFRYIKVALYTGKDILSNFVIKAILQKSISRSSVRVYIPLVSTLITGFWDAWVQQKALSEVRLRISARVYVLNQLAELEAKDMSQAYVTALLRLIAVRQSYKQECDVNLEYFYDQLYKSKQYQLNDLESVDLLLISVNALTNEEKAELTVMMEYLFYFRRNPTRNEKALLYKLGALHASKNNPLLC